MPSCVCADATLPARVVASTANATHAFLILFEFSFSMFSMCSKMQNPFRVLYRYDWSASCRA
jgi:hypothetical protein